MSQAAPTKGVSKLECPHTYAKGRHKGQKCPNMGTHNEGYCSRHHKLPKVATKPEPYRGAGSSAGRYASIEPLVPVRTVAAGSTAGEAPQAKATVVKKNSLAETVNKNTGNRKCIQLELPKNKGISKASIKRVVARPIRKEAPVQSHGVSDSNEKKTIIGVKTPSVNSNSLWKVI